MGENRNSHLAPFSPNRTKIRKRCFGVFSTFEPCRTFKRDNLRIHDLLWLARNGILVVNGSFISLTTKTDLSRNEIKLRGFLEIIVTTIRIMPSLGGNVKHLEGNLKLGQSSEIFFKVGYASFKIVEDHSKSNRYSKVETFFFSLLKTDDSE